MLKRRYFIALAIAIIVSATWAKCMSWVARDGFELSDFWTGFVFGGMLVVYGIAAHYWYVWEEKNAKLTSGASKSSSERKA